MVPRLYIVIPCYNEEAVLPITAPMFLKKIKDLMERKKISEESRVFFVDDGSKDGTWDIIRRLSDDCVLFQGIRLSRNRGHQNALLAGLMTAKEKCDITISIDCDGQDDINAMDQMVDEYLGGAEVVYGVRSSRKTDTFFKRMTAQGYYKCMNLLGAEIVYNHADYRLVSSKVLDEFADFKEVNIFLRGMFPLVGYKSTCVPYERRERIAGVSHYPLRKMLSFAFDGITSFSVKPIRFITILGFIVALLSVIGILWAVYAEVTGNSVAGWASLASIVCFLGGVQLLSIGIIGEYVGKMYLETKARPRYIISESTDGMKKLL